MPDGHAGAGVRPGRADAVERAAAVLADAVGDAVGRSGEPIAAHAAGTLSILAALNVDEPTRVAALLFGAGEALPLDRVEQSFGEEVPRRFAAELDDLTLAAWRWLDVNFAIEHNPGRPDAWTRYWRTCSVPLAMCSV